MVIEKTQTQSREAIIVELYKSAFPEVAGFIRSMGGSLEQTKDIFQDALVIYYEKKLQEDFVPDHGHATYLKGIAKYLWYKNFRETKSIRPLTEDLHTLSFFEEEPKVSSRLIDFLKLSGKRCLELLSAFYYEQVSMKEMADRFGFSGERSATAQKYKCLEKVRELVREQTLNKDDFYE